MKDPNEYIAWERTRRLAEEQFARYGDAHCPPWVQGVRDAESIIQSLEAPFILTDTPPSDSGWYVCIDKRPEVLKAERLTNGDILINGFPAEAYPNAKWGSAPLPLPRGDEDE